jgi:hypothetical protein
MQKTALCHFERKSRNLALCTAGLIVSDDFHTVFEIASGIGGIEKEAYLRLAIGAIVLLVGVACIVLFATRRENDRWKPKLFTAVFLPVWAIFWLSISIPAVLSINRERHDLLTAYRTGKYAVVEGPVRVLRIQPPNGHAPGDLVSVNGKQFKFNFYSTTHAYHRTIEHGGDLRGGVYARVLYCDGDIIRVDVRAQQ